MPPSLVGPVEIIAHRGYSTLAPENTVAALELAIERGADALEFDVQAAIDGSPYLFHDHSLDRTTDGNGRFVECPRERLAELDAGSWFDPAFAGEPVPPLRAALDAVRGRVGRIYPEIKAYRELSDVDRIRETVEDADMIGSTVFISMDWRALKRVREARSDAAIAYIVESPDRIEPGFSLAERDPLAMLDFDARILLADPTLGRRARSAGVELATWTVNAVEDAARLLDMGVRRITTNEVGRLLDWKDSL